MSPTGVSKKWDTLTPVPGGKRYLHGFVASPAGDCLYVIGGYLGSALKSCYRYCIAEDEWMALTELPVAVCNNGGFYHCRDGVVEEYCVGSVGNSEDIRGQLLVYNVSTKELDFAFGEWVEIHIGIQELTRRFFAQVCQLNGEEAIVVLGEGITYQMNMGRKFILSPLQTLTSKPFYYTCSFALSKNKLGIFGDRGEKNTIFLKRD